MIKTSDLIKITIFPVLIASTLWISIPMVGAPITLQTLFVLLAGLILGKNKGALSMLLYLLMGAIGLPVFAGYAGGLGIIAGPTGGFLLSFPFAAYVVGYIYERYKSPIAATIVGTLVVYYIGVPWLATYLEWPLTTAITAMYVYIPGDILKIVAAVTLIRRDVIARL